MNHYIHNTPGRLRLKIPSLKRNMPKIQEISLLLKERPGIEFLEINEITGSLKINYDRQKTDSKDLLKLLSEEGYVDIARLVPSHQYMDRMFSKVGESASRMLFNIAVDKAFEGSSLSMITAFI